MMLCFNWISTHTLLRGVTHEQIRYFFLQHWHLTLAMRCINWDVSCASEMTRHNEVSFWWFLCLIVVKHCFVQDKNSISFSMGSSHIWCRRSFCYDDCLICCSCRGLFTSVLVQYISMSPLLLVEYCPVAHCCFYCLLKVECRLNSY